MSFLSKINQFRRGVMRGLTKDIGKQKTDYGILMVDKSEIKRILICRPNGRLGNLLLITPLVKEVAATFPNCKIDLFVKGTLAPIIFENYEAYNKSIPLPKKPFKSLIDYIKVWVSIMKEPYDMAINVDQNSSSGRLAVRFSNAKYKFYGDLDENQVIDKSDYEHIAKYPVYNFRNYLSKLGIEKSNRIIASVDLNLSSSEFMNGKKKLDELVTNSKKTICIFTYATGNKCLTEEWWGDFYKALKDKYREYNIIEILPVENVSQIGFQAPSFYSKDIREIGAVIANTELFIGADSGIMHLASSVQTPTAGLFSVSNLKKYEPYDNSSIGIDIYSYSKNDYFKVFNAILSNGRIKSLSKAV
ncbi:glycosyltransferase family 9 protein [Flavobacterium reichenbachii]|uniref:ADP-heptose--LPS heptosyltransferase n=1 Tax=Flavobacterium reichenbachii TaxID=362418 RepID=A0A085ZQQ5_9FLAO|nr:glycosyltransferase family 9 protein [Flavobacterium reichenbachii]KFF06769.1 ADP-heptose--LPS heptosyltransferase [Flavobacterium reichenbachii]OXB18630.1 ADP-heptose--LPS heptosyltransferase [Flavobacterium reichenbachii]